MQVAGALSLDGAASDARRARALVASLSGTTDDLRDDIALVLSELTANACLHGAPPVTVRLLEDDTCIRVEVTDAGRSLPVPPLHNPEAMTGRGFSLVAALTSEWGVSQEGNGGKTVWAEFARDSARRMAPAGGSPGEWDIDNLLSPSADPAATGGSERYPVRLGGVPTTLLIDAETHIDDVVRELELVHSRADEQAQPLPEAVQALVHAVTRDFSEPRGIIKRLALQAAAAGEAVTELSLDLPLTAADAAERYLEALEEVDRQSRSARMLTLAPARSHIAFRRWYLASLIGQLRAAARGEPAPQVMPFAQVMAGQVDDLASLLETQTRLQLLQAITRGLTESESAEQMAALVVDAACTHQGVDSARVWLRAGDGVLRSAAWRNRSADTDAFDELPPDADLPVAVVARTGQPLHARTLGEVFDQFPALGSTPPVPRERSLHIAPLSIAGNVIGVLSLVFAAGDISDEAQQAFVTAIADALAQAIERSFATERAEAERRRELAVLRAQSQALAEVVAGKPLVDVLDSLLLAVEGTSSDGMLTSVLLLDRDGSRLRHAAAPSLPPEYNAAIDGTEIGPQVGSCGTAAYLGERVVVEDIATDERWVRFRDLAAQAGLRACWSTPITGADGELLGTFATYHSTPHRPDDTEVAFVDILVETVALIIERSRVESGRGQPALQDEAAQHLALELAVGAGGVGTFDWNLVTGELLWDQHLLEIFDFDRQQRSLTIENFFEAVHPGDRERVRALLDQAIQSVGDYEAEYRIVLPDGSARWIAARGRALPGRDGTAVRLLGAAQDTTARRDADARVARVMDSLSTAFFFLDRTWHFAFLNAEAERVLGRSRQELLGQEVWTEFPAAVGSDFETNYRHAASTGERVAFDAYYPEPLNAWYEVQAWPSPDGLAVYFIDVTERRAAQEVAQRAISRAGLLARVSEQLARTIDPEASMRSLAQIVTPSVGEWCVVSLIGDEAHTGTRRGLGASVGWHTDPALRATVDHYARTRLDQMTDQALIVRAVETAEPQIHNGDAMATLRQMFQPGAEPLRILQELDTYAIAILPLVGQEHPVGMLSVVNSSKRGRFSDEDLDLLRDIAARAGLVLDRARLYRQQRAVAESLQRSMLHLPLVGRGLEVAVAYVPAAEVAQVGGDWYDAFPQPDGSTTLIIGDVMGHDLLAAAAMGETRTLVRTLAAQHLGAPGLVLDDAERVMRLLSLNTLATVVVGRLDGPDEVSGEFAFTFANAGHPPPLLVAPDGSVDVLGEDPVHPLLGVGDFAHADRTVPLPAGSTLVLYTDGLVERRDQPVETGIERLRATLAGLSGAPPDAVRDAILELLLPPRAEDDVAVLVVRATGE